MPNARENYLDGKFEKLSIRFILENSKVQCFGRWDFSDKKEVSFNKNVSLWSDKT